MNTILNFIIFVIIIVFGLFLFFKGLSLLSNSLNSIKNFSFLNNISRLPFYLLVLIGSLTSAILQSTSFSISIILPLVSKKIINFKTSVFLIIGFNLGTVSSLLISGFNPFLFSSVLLFLSIFLLIVSIIKKNTIFKVFSYVCLGLVATFISLNLIKYSFLFFKKSCFYPYFLSRISSSSFYSFLLGTIMSCILQSGSVVCGTIQQLYVQTSVNLKFVLLVIIGSNIGSTITGVLAGLKETKEARFIAMFNVIFNLLGAVVSVFLIGVFIKIIKYISFANGLSKDLEVALCHLLFNFISCIAIIPFLIFLFSINKKYKS